MLELLHIENLAVIETADIQFYPGFNALTGETGAGKSIVVDAMQAVLGGRASRDLIRTGAVSAFVSAVFSGLPQSFPALAACGAAPDEEGKLLLQREITADGRNVCRANGRPLTVSQLRAVGAELLNIHGQHEGAQLLDEERHGEYLDRYGRTEGVLSAYQKEYEALLAIRRRMGELRMDEAEKARRMDSLRFQIDELERADLRPREDEELRARRDFLRSGEKYLSALEGAAYALGGGDDSDGAARQLQSAAEALAPLRSLGGEFAGLCERVQEAAAEVYDLSEILRDKREEFDFSPGELDAVESRCDQLYRLKKKYGATAEDMLDYLERCRRDRDICIYRCHMGLTEATAPILADGAVIGYLMFGQLLARDGRAEVLRRLEALKGLESKAALRGEIARMEEKDEHTLRAAARLLSMCACYIRLHPLLRSQQKNQALPLAQYIEENLADPELSIPQLCAVFGVSRGTLYQRSRAAFQMGITDYIRQARLNAALMLLRQTDLPLYAVAAQVGIGDPDYLARLVKKQTGKSPRRLRQESDAPAGN